MPNLSPEHKKHQAVSKFYAQGTDLKLFFGDFKNRSTFWKKTFREVRASRKLRLPIKNFIYL